MDVKMKRAEKDKKAPLEYLIWPPLVQVALAMQSGAEKYGFRNWRDTGIHASTYAAAINRHVNLEWMTGVDADKDTGVHPLAHVIASCLIVMDAESRGVLTDDRDKKEQNFPTIMDLAGDL